MKQPKKTTYQVWLVIFAFAFILSFLGRMFGLMSLIAVIVRNPEMLETELYPVIQGGIITLIDGILAVVAIILSRRIRLG